MSIYRQSTLGTTSNRLTFNQLGSYPYYRMQSRQPTRREIVEFDIKLPEGTGDADYQTLIGKTYLLLSGTMYPSSDVTYAEGRRALRNLASLEIQQADPLSDSGYVPYTWVEEDGYYQQLFLKVLYVDLPENSRNGLKQPFRLLCKIKYPVIFSQSVLTASLGNSGATTSGTSNLSFTLPRAIGLTSYTSNGAFNNLGSLSTYPSVQINGPISNPRVTNSTTGEFIQVNVNLLTTGDTLSISYDQDSLDITTSTGSVLSSLTSDSTLFKLPAGTSQLTLSGATVGSGASATVSARAAWPLS